MSCVVDICFLNGAFSCYCEGYVSCNKFVVKETIERTNTREKKWADSDTSMPFSNSAAPSSERAPKAVTFCFQKLTGT